MSNREIGLRIANARRDAGMTAKELAQRVQVAASTITRYEKGEIDNIKMPVISEIARQLHVNPMWIIGRSSHMRTDDMIQDWDAASSIDLKSAIQNADVLFYGDRHKISPAERQQVEKILAAVLAEEDDES